MESWYSSTDLYQYLSRDDFWILGILLAVNGWWTNRQLELFIEDQDEAIRMHQSELETREKPQVANGTSRDRNNESWASDEDSGEEIAGSARSPPTAAPPISRNVFLLQPHITSRTRLVLVLIACAVIIGLQFIEGFGVFVTAWRITLATLRNTYPSIRPRIFGFILYLPITIIMVSSWLTIIWVAVFLGLQQLLYFLHLLRLRLPGTSVLVTPDNEKDQRYRE